MSAATPSELNASAILSLIQSGTYPRDVVLTLARGFLPLPQDDLIAVLAFLVKNDDAEIAETARASLTEMPSRIVHAFASNENAAPEHLGYLAAASGDSAILEALIRNRALANEAVVELARGAEAALQEVIVINQARILRAPEILDALLENPQLSADVRRRALETREEFFEKKARAAEAAALMEPDLVELPLDAINDLLEQAESTEQAPAAQSVPDLPEFERGDPDKQSVWAKVLKMSVSQKVQLAFKGDKTVRMILVRERNKLVCSAAMRNPRMSEAEVESIAGMRNVDEEVLRLIGVRRDWVAKYPIALALVRNPKAPIGIVLPIINRLTLRDLKGLKDDKGVSEVVRSTARRLYVARTTQNKS